MRTAVVAFGVTLFLDQLSKFLVQSQVVNTGVSLGLAKAVPNTVMTLGLGVVVGVFLIGARKLWQRHPLLSGIFFGAALSNLLDRVFFGGVRDWLSVPGLGLKNNLADWLILLAIIGIMWTETTKKAN